MNLPDTIENEHQLSLDFVGKIQEIDSAYKKTFSRYQEQIAKFNLDIELLKNKISLKKESLVQDEQLVTSLENSLLHEEHFAEKLNSKFTQKIESLYELQHEYRASMEAEQYERLLVQKEQSVQELLFEIEEQELTLLNRELERINRVNLLLPEQNLLKEMESQLEALLLEKSYFESAQLENQFLLGSGSDEVETIETEVLEKGD